MTGKIKARLLNVLAAMMLFFAFPIYSVVGEMVSASSNASVTGGMLLFLALIYGVVWAFSRLLRLLDETIWPELKTPKQDGK